MSAADTWGSSVSAAAAAAASSSTWANGGGVGGAGDGKEPHQVSAASGCHLAATAPAGLRSALAPWRHSAFGASSAFGTGSSAFVGGGGTWGGLGGGSAATESRGCQRWARRSGLGGGRAGLGGVSVEGDLDGLNLGGNMFSSSCSFLEEGGGNQ